MRARRPLRADKEGDGAPTRVTPKAQAVRWLARRDYSRAEIAQRLRQRGVGDADIERALDELATAGYLSDARYANAVVEQRKGRFGKRAIVHVLKERGIAAPDAAAALEQLAGTDEVAEAHALWEQRFGRPPKDEREKARQVRFLMARGYGVSVALKVLRGAGLREPEESA